MAKPTESVMPMVVAIVDPAAAFRRGVAACLQEAGFAYEEPDDLASWGSQEGRRAILVTVRPPAGWEPLTSIQCQLRGVTMVALIVGATPETYARALRLGVDGAAPWDAEPEVILKVLLAAIDSFVLLPGEVGRAIAAGASGCQDPQSITPEETEWLQLLARGMSVHDLAVKMSYSERAMFRFLAALYSKLGVSNRAEAILSASQQGLIH